MAQTAALEYGLSGYGQNSLPISAQAQNDLPITNVGGYANAVTIWQAVGNTFSEVNVQSDPATSHYAGLAYLSTTTTSLASPYGLLEVVGLAEGNPADVALAAYDAHSIGTVISLDLSSPTTADTSVIDAFLQGNNSAVDEAINNDQLTASQTNVVTANAPDGLPLSASVLSEGTNSDSYAVTLNGQANQTVTVATIGSAVTVTTSIDQGATVEDFQDQFGQSGLTGITQAYEFSGSSGTLLIDNPASFTGMISNFQPGDTIDLAGVGAVIGTTFSGSDVLTLQESGGGSVSLNLDPTGNYSSESFLIAPDGSGGAQIVAESDTQTIAFTGTGEDLLVVSPRSLSGTISNFQVGDTIDLAGVSATSAILDASNVLTVQETNGGSVALQLDPTQNFSSTFFNVQGDGASGADISSGPLAGQVMLEVSGVLYSSPYAPLTSSGGYIDSTSIPEAALIGAPFSLALTLNQPVNDPVPPNPGTSVTYGMQSSQITVDGYTFNSSNSSSDGGVIFSSTQGSEEISFSFTFAPGEQAIVDIVVTVHTPPCRTRCRLT